MQSETETKYPTGIYAHPPGVGRPDPALPPEQRPARNRYRVTLALEKVDEYLMTDGVNSNESGSSRADENVISLGTFDSEKEAEELFINARSFNVPIVPIETDAGTDNEQYWAQFHQAMADEAEAIQELLNSAVERIATWLKCSTKARLFPGDGADPLWKLLVYGPIGVGDEVPMWQALKIIREARLLVAQAAVTNTEDGQSASRRGSRRAAAGSTREAAHA